MSLISIPPNQKFFTIAEVADLFHFHSKTIRRWIAADELTAHKFGRSWRISRENLNTFANERKKHVVRDVL